MFTKILGSGRFVPKKVLSNLDLETMVDTSDEWIRKRTGIVERRLASPEETLTVMASKASRAALEDAGVAAADIDLILCTTSSPDYAFPSVSARLQRQIGATGAACFDISAACTGFVTAFDTADAFLRTGKARRVLIASVERLSDVVDYTDRTTCVLFGDAAAAVVLGADEKEGLRASFLGCKSDGWEHIYGKTGEFMYMNGKEVYKYAVRILQEAAEAVLTKAGRDIAEVRWVIPHQANARIIESALQKWDVPSEKVLMSIAETGNTSSASIPSLYDKHRRAGDIREGQLLLMVAFGAGLTYGALLYGEN